MAKTILIVDDDANARTTLADILAEYGYKIVEASVGKEVLGKVQRVKPDIVVLDTRLPDIDGNEVCRQIKKIKGLITKVIVYTGYVDTVDAAKARAAGANDYVVKTSDFSYLIEAVKKLI